MLQITSLNKETAIDPELVQNGNFDEVSTTNLVTNGTFDDIGDELVTNGDFSATGSELVTDGNFSATGSEIIEPIANRNLSSDTGFWTLETGATFGTNQIDFNTVSTNYGFYNTTLLTANKFYVATFEIKDWVSGAVRVNGGGNYFGNESGNGIKTVYLNSNSGATTFGIQSNVGGANLSVTNLTLKELGEGWVSVTDTGSVTFANNQVQIISDGSAQTGIYQDILTIGKSYKVTIDVASITGEFKLQMGTGTGDIGTQVVTTAGSQTYYLKASGSNGYFFIYRNVGESVDVVINSVTVKELGEDWTLGSSSDGVTPFITAQGITISNGALGGNSNFAQGLGLVEGKSYKLQYDIISNANSNSLAITEYGSPIPSTVGTHVIYFVGGSTAFLQFLRYSASEANTNIVINNITVKEVGQNWTVENGWVIETGFAKITPDGVRGFLYQNFTVENYKSYRLTYQILENTLVGGTDFHLSSESSFGAHALPSTVAVHNVYIQVTNTTSIKALRFFSSATSGTLKMSNIYLKLLDPDEDWILSSNDLSIGENKAIFNNTTIGENINQQKFTIEENVTYRASFSVLDYVSGSVQWKTTGGSNPISFQYEADGNYTFDFIGDVEGGTSGIRIYGSSISNNKFAVTNVSVKKLATYLDQSIYVTAADVQTIAQATVSYLIELKSMASQNSIYFIPTSITANNGRFTKMNFTVVSKDGITDPADGIISFYDSNGGEDTYPMGFYEFKIYEQPILPVNLDPTNATKLLEKGTAFVQNINGNTSEITSAFNEYDPTLTQYVYSQ